MASNIAAKIASVDDEEWEDVPVPEWDVTLRMKSLTLADRTRVAKESRDKKGNTDTTKYYPRVIIASAHDPETGEKVFGLQHIPMLERKNSRLTDKLAKVAMRLSGLIDPDETEDDLPDDAPERDALADATEEERIEARAKRDLDAAGKDSSSEGATSGFGS